MRTWCIFYTLCKLLKRSGLPNSMQFTATTLMSLSLCCKITNTTESSLLVTLTKYFLESIKESSIPMMQAGHVFSLIALNVIYSNKTQRLLIYLSFSYLWKRFIKLKKNILPHNQIFLCTQNRGWSTATRYHICKYQNIKSEAECAEQFLVH